jgi:ribosomal-protein-alanine N-acetyltransferase
MRTPRLDLIATTLAHLDTELDAPERLAPMLDALVPSGWPPCEYDADAMRFFRERLQAEGASSAGWYGWYAVRRATSGEPATLVAGGGYFGPPNDGRVEIGYSVVESHRGQGFATELRRAGFHDVGAGSSPAMRRFERTRVPLA